MLRGPLPHGMNCVSTIDHDGQPTMLLRNKPDDSGQDVTDGEVGDLIAYVEPRLPATARALCYQRRGIDAQPTCVTVPPRVAGTTADDLPGRNDDQHPWLFLGPTGAIVFGVAAFTLLGLAPRPASRPDEDTSPRAAE